MRRNLFAVLVAAVVALSLGVPAPTQAQQQLIFIVELVDQGTHVTDVDVRINVGDFQNRRMDEVAQGVYEYIYENPPSTLHEWNAGISTPDVIPVNPLENPFLPRGLVWEERSIVWEVDDQRQPAP